MSGLGKIKSHKDTQNFENQTCTKMSEYTYASLIQLNQRAWNSRKTTATPKPNEEADLQFDMSDINFAANSPVDPLQNTTSMDTSNNDNFFNFDNKALDDEFSDFFDMSMISEQPTAPAPITTFQSQLYKFVNQMSNYLTHRMRIHQQSKVAFMYTPQHMAYLPQDHAFMFKKFQSMKLGSHVDDVFHRATYNEFGVEFTDNPMDIHAQNSHCGCTNQGKCWQCYSKMAARDYNTNPLLYLGKSRMNQDLIGTFSAMSVPAYTPIRNYTGIVLPTLRLKGSTDRHMKTHLLKHIDQESHHGDITITSESYGNETRWVPRGENHNCFYMHLPTKNHFMNIVLVSGPSGICANEQLVASPMC
jgi:hypothetical protein